MDGSFATQRNVTEHDRHSARLAEAQRAGLWSRDLDYLLNEASVALGERGTLASVVASIERCGAAGSSDDPNLAMLRRIGWHDEGTPAPRERRHRNIERVTALTSRWHRQPVEHRTTHTVHYLLTRRVDRRIVARCGMLAGAVLREWLESFAGERGKTLAPRIDELRDEQARLLAELEPIEPAIAAARAQVRACWRLVGSPLVPDGSACVYPPWRIDERQAVLMRTRAAHLDGLARPLRTRLQAARKAEAELVATMADGGSEAALRALVSTCEKGDPPREVTDAAERRVRVAHAAWDETAHADARAWAEGA